MNIRKPTDGERSSDPRSKYSELWAMLRQHGEAFVEDPPPNFRSSVYANAKVQGFRVTAISVNGGFYVKVRS